MIISLFIRRGVQYKYCWKLYYSHKSRISSTWYANLYSNYNRIMSEHIAICIFLYVWRTPSRPNFVRNNSALKITKLKIYFKKKRNNSLFQQYFNPKLSKYRFLTIFGKLGFGRVDSANWKSTKWESANWY